MKKSKKPNAVLLQMAVIGLLLSLTPADAQTTDSTTTNTTTTTQSTPDVGMVEGVPVRKDAWSWYWNEKAHVAIDPQDHFWGDDIISNFFRNICNSFVIPFWNAAMEYDFIRAGLLLVVAGMLLGLGASVFLPKKPETK